MLEAAIGIEPMNKGFAVFQSPFLLVFLRFACVGSVNVLLRFSLIEFDRVLPKSGELAHNWHTDALVRVSAQTGCYIKR